jgi:hypothetical protein
MTAMGNAGYGNHTEDTQKQVESERSGKPKPAEEAGSRDGTAPKPSDRLPPAGPHADPKLTNPDATPGTGVMTPAGKHDDIDSTSG